MSLVVDVRAIKETTRFPDLMRLRLLYITREPEKWKLGSGRARLYTWSREGPEDSRPVNGQANREIIS